MTRASLEDSIVVLRWCQETSILQFAYNQTMAEMLSLQKNNSNRDFTCPTDSYAEADHNGAAVDRFSRF